MAPRAHIFSLIFLGALALGNSFAWAETSSSRIPTPRSEPTRTQEPDPDRRVVCNGLKDEAANCVNQADSFERMAQAYSYLGHYMMNYSAFGVAMKKNEVVEATQQAVIDCATGSPACTKNKQEMMVAALIQYNLGKSVKSMILQNNTNKDKLNSVPLTGYRSAPFKPKSTGNTYTESFKLTSQHLQTAQTYVPKDEAARKDMDKLGEEFKQDYLKFIDTYSNSSGQEKWNYEHAKKAGAEGTSQWVIDPETNSPRLDRTKQAMDEFQQSQEPVKNAVKTFKDSITAPKFSRVEEENKDAPKGQTASSRSPASQPKKNSNQISVDGVDGLRFRDLSLGTPAIVTNQKDGSIYPEEKVPGAIAGQINHDIDEATKRERQRLGKAVGTVNVQISMERFDEYLAKIWPSTNIRDRIPSQYK